MKMNKWLKGATALILALSFNVGADVANGQVEFSAEIGDAPAPVTTRQTTRPTSTSNRAQSAKSPRSEAERFWSGVAGEATRAEESTGKRYLVNFILTAQYDYVNKREIPEGLLENIVGSYCVSTLALNWGGFDETITISGEYLNKKQVDKVFDILAKKTKPNDEIFIYWNGHAGAVHLAESDGNVVRFDLGVKDEADGFDESLSLYESHKPVQNPRDLRNQEMLDDDLAANFKKLEGRRVLAFFEVCNAAGLANPEQVQVTGRAVSRYSDEFELPCVDTWEELKSQADSTSKWLSAEKAREALQFVSVGLQLDENGVVTPIESDEPSEENNENAAATAATDENKEYSDAAVIFSNLDAQVKQGSKGAKRAKAEEIGPSLDLSTDTLEHFAVAFTSLETENSRAGLITVLNGQLGVRIVNPGAFALFLTILDARVNERKATFADFRNALDHIVVQHNDLERTLVRINPVLEPVLRSDMQTPGYLSNADGMTIYDPSREN